MKSLKIAIISESASNWPMYIGLEQGFFAQEGLVVDITITNSSKKQLEAMEKGVYDIGFAAADHIIRGVINNNSNLFMFLGAASPFYNLITPKDINNFQDLKGCRLGVDGKNTGYALLLETLLKHNEVQPAEYELVEIGGSDKRQKALANGEIQGTFLDAPLDIEAESRGFNSLGSNLDCIPNYQGRTVASRRIWAHENEDVLISFIRAYIKSVDWFYNLENKNKAVQCLLSKLDISRITAEKAYDRYFKYKVINEKGFLNLIGLQEVMKVMQRLGQIKDGTDISKVYDLSFANKVRGWE